ncbi:hypothetical protein PF008_g3800 [Phytophthora fragariae]|uniref:Uncharacterized protein n=1 Tax=Phytophthora fragariae TaxID=53985 RepID=A0A6G0SD65_9STRA|nr:hypothetical protein PF008_g3800 [Phytophthora fragariae]
MLKHASFPNSHRRGQVAARYARRRCGQLPPKRAELAPCYLVDKRAGDKAAKCLPSNQLVWPLQKWAMPITDADQQLDSKPRIHPCPSDNKSPHRRTDTAIVNSTSLCSSQPAGLLHRPTTPLNCEKKLESGTRKSTGPLSVVMQRHAVQPTSHLSCSYAPCEFVVALHGPTASRLPRGQYNYGYTVHYKYKIKYQHKYEYTYKYHYQFKCWSTPW